MSTIDENNNIPITKEQQIELMKKYVLIRKTKNLKKHIDYCGYFRLSRYGKFLLSFSELLGGKVSQKNLFDLYKFDKDLRELCFKYSKIIEVQLKTNISNSISIKLNDAVFYLNECNYNPSKGAKDKIKRVQNENKYKEFIKALKNEEKKIRLNSKQYPELKDYRKGGSRYNKKLPSWVLFSYLDFGSILYIFAFLRGDLKKEIIKYGYGYKRCTKAMTSVFGTWIDAIRNLRNVCVHHNKLIGKTSSIVLCDPNDNFILLNNNNLFSRLYVFAKLLDKKNLDDFLSQLKRIINISNLNIYDFKILPKDWEKQIMCIKSFYCE